MYQDILSSLLSVSVSPSYECGLVAGWPKSCSGCRDFPTFLKSGLKGPVEFGKKAFQTIKLGKPELDRHFKWIKKHIRNSSVKLL